MAFGKAISLVLLLYGCRFGNGNISPKVISLQQLLFKELQTLEQSAFISTPPHASQGEDVFSRLREVFHEFERQNQECITAVLRVLALVDHTLENTIQGCEKVFHLPSLDSGNVLFREVTRPLLLHVEELCQHIASGETDNLQSTMEEVEREAALYRQRLDETKRNMQIVLAELDKESMFFATSNKMDDLFDQIEPLNASIRNSIAIATESFLERQQTIRHAILQSPHSGSDEELDIVLSNFMAFLENETNLLIEGLTEELEDWFNQTEMLVYSVGEEVKSIPRVLMEAPVEDFLHNNASLKCLAEFNSHEVVQKTRNGLEKIAECYDIADDTERPFGMAMHLLNATDYDTYMTLQGILGCLQTNHHTGNIAINFGEVMSCFEMSQSVVEALQEFIEAQMDEMYFHVDAAMYFNELKMETCVYYKAREMMLDISLVNRRYQKCNEEVILEVK